ncbi:MAG: DUF554 domain-containing protein [Acholeplasmataceae bacterium]
MGTLINAAAIIIASFVGLIFKSKLHVDYTKQLKIVMGLVLLLMGIGWFMSDFIYIESNILQTQHELIILISIILGTALGSFLKLDERFRALIKNIESKYQLPPMAEGFITSSLIFCIGAIAILGVFQDVIEGNLTLLYIKSILDFITAIILASTLGIGVLFSFISVLLYQGLIMLIAITFAPVLPVELMTYLSLVGNVLIVALAIDFLEIKSLKVLNMLPSLMIPILYVVMV